nr:nickel insertion protein [Methanobacterium formicicum]
MDKIHFHEVGAADAVADIMGASYAFHELGLNGKKNLWTPPGPWRGPDKK